MHSDRKACSSPPCAVRCQGNSRLPPSWPTCPGSAGNGASGAFLIRKPRT